MKGLIFVIVIIILFYLLWQAWNKKTIDFHVELPKPRKKEIRKIPKKSTSYRSTKESVCREIFERVFSRPFPTKRPSFLKNPETGRNLELDGFNSDLHLAFEYNGRQHYDFPNTFHKTEDDFVRQVGRDAFKKKKCEKEGVRLITIPYTVDTPDLERFIKTKLHMYGYNV